MKCLILAAGKGKRLSQKGDSKPLIPLLGVHLIERVIRSANTAGIDDFYVVTGYNGEKVRRFLDDLAERCRITISHVINDEWEKDNGISVLKARSHFHENFVLLMADHLFDPELLRVLIEQPLGEGEVTLAIDSNTDNGHIDIDDVTRVEVKNGKVVNIGKKLKSFNSFDTGIFLCSPALFEGIERSITENGDSTLSGGVRKLTADGRFNAFDIDERFWIDVDDPKDMDKAEHAVISQLKSKPNDGPISKYLNRPLSTRISGCLVKTSLTPNHISVVSFVLSFLAAGLFAAGGYLTLLAGGMLAQFASVIDGCDGEVARLKYLESSFGGWFDAVLDRYADAFLLFGLTWHVYVVIPDARILGVGFMAIIGTFMLSYTADKYDGLMRTRVESGKGIRIGRDVRVFMIFLGALFNQPFAILLIIAVLMNVEVIRRVLVCRRHE